MMLGEDKCLVYKVLMKEGSCYCRMYMIYFLYFEYRPQSVVVTERTKIGFLHVHGSYNPSDTAENDLFSGLFLLRCLFYSAAGECCFVAQLKPPLSGLQYAN